MVSTGRRIREGLGRFKTHSPVAGALQSSNRCASNFPEFPGNSLVPVWAEVFRPTPSYAAVRTNNPTTLMQVIVQGCRNSREFNAVISSTATFEPLFRPSHSHRLFGLLFARKATEL